MIYRHEPNGRLLICALGRHASAQLEAVPDRFEQGQCPPVHGIGLIKLASIAVDVAQVIVDTGHAVLITDGLIDIERLLVHGLGSV